MENFENLDDYFDYADRRQHEELLIKIVEKPLNTFDIAVSN